MLSSCNMVEEDNLGVVAAFDFNSLGSITGWVFVWINVYHLTISFVSEQEASIGVGIYSEVRRVGQRSSLTLPVVVTQICRMWLESDFILVDRFEILSFKTVSQVYIARHLGLSLHVSDEDNGCHSSISDVFFSLFQCF